MHVKSRANSIFPVSGSSTDERTTSVISNLSGLSSEYDSSEFTSILALPDILVNRNSILAHRLTGHLDVKYNVITHSNKNCFMPYLDYQFCRNDITDPNRPNGGARSPYSRRHILVAFMQDIQSSEYFANNFWRKTFPRSHYIWSETADILMFSDGIFLGQLWWPKGVSQLSDVPQVGGPI